MLAAGGTVADGSVADGSVAYGSAWGPWGFEVDERVAALEKTLDEPPPDG